MEQFTMRDFFTWEVISVNRRRNREVRPRLKSQHGGSLSWLLWATGAHATRIHKRVSVKAPPPSLQNFPPQNKR